MVPTQPQTDNNPSKITAKSKKEDILSAYEDLLAKFQNNAETAQERQTSINRKYEEQIVQKAAAASPQEIVTNVSRLETTVRKWLTDLAELLINEAKKLNEVQQAITIEQKQLEEIHQIKTEADTLANLTQAHKDKKQQLEEEFEMLENQLQQDINDQKEQWRREKESYEYELNLQRRKEESEYQQKRSVKEQELKQREELLTQQEKELEELKKLKLKFDKELQETSERARKEAIEKTRLEEEVKTKLTAEKYNADKKIAELTIESLKKRLSEQEQDIARLKQELEISNRGVKDIALKVIEGNSRTQEHRNLKAYDSEKNTKEEKMTV